MQLPTRETVVVDPNARVSLFTPEGNLIVGERDGSLARYCRTP
jgi:DNA topoisomerase VI subunit B